MSMIEVMGSSPAGAAGYPVITVWPAEFESVFLNARRHGASFVEALRLASGHVRPLQEFRRPNKVTTAGLNLIRDWACGDVPGGFSYLAVGGDGTAETGASTQLGAEGYRDVLHDKEKTALGLISRYYLTTTMANGLGLREAGLIAGAATGAANSGTLYARITHELIGKDISKGVTYQWTTPWAAL